MTLFAGSEAAQIAGGELLAGPEAQITGVAIDSRQVQPGDLFVAIRGERVDGHAYVPVAVARGATAVLVEAISPEWRLPAGVAVIRVADPVLALGRLGLYHRRRFPGLRVTAVTGSVGKTTTKDLTAAVLAQGFRLLKTEGNLNTEIGLPLTLLRLTPAAQAAVLEMGMRGPGQIEYLASLAEPRVGVITNIGRTHLELLGSEENIMRAKAELVAALPQDGFAVLNNDDPWTPAVAEHTRARIIRYGWERGAGMAGEPGAVSGPRPRPDVTAADVRGLGPAGTSFRLVTPAGAADLLLPLPGRHNIANALAAAAVGHAWGLSPEQIAAGLAAARISDKRLNVIEVGSVTVINDTYNASPVSTRAALEVLAGFQAGRRLAVLGNMLELGEYAAAGHREVGEAAARLGVDRLVCVGDLAANIAVGACAAGLPAEHVTAVPDNQAAAAALAGLVRPGDAVLVKGSRGMAMEQIVAALEQQWGTASGGAGEGSSR
ncbi:MAG: UDP-N-acetylmuramoyl-tripeptide--D-alanyl-D-alanine ligase [Symbiobacteriia bacterium]